VNSKPSGSCPPRIDWNVSDLYKTLVEDSVEGILVADPETKIILYANPAAQAMVDSGQAGFLSKPFHGPGLSEKVASALE